MTTPPNTLHFFIVDDDKTSIDLYTKLLKNAGHQVTSTHCSKEALEQVLEIQPDCVLCDLTMPDLDGFQLFQQLQKYHPIKKPTFIIITNKIFEFDRKHALEIGIDGYLTKPIDSRTFVEEVLKIISDTVIIEFWGVRGTLPVPGTNTTRFGGNTNCVTLTFSKRHFFSFDAGTGIKELSNHLVKENKFPLKAQLFISHPHYDHIQGIPFFVPLYMKGNEFEILGTKQGDLSLKAQIENQMDSVYFPITTSEFASKLSFRDLSEEEFDIDDIHITTILLNHPGRCLGYRVEYKHKSFCYITDNELYLENSPHYNQFEVDRLIHFIQGADVVVMDTTYTDEEYATKTGWGHSSVSRVVDVADKAKVKLLCLFHHDPDQLDRDITLKVKQAQTLLKERHSNTRCIAPHEGSKIVI